MTRRASTTVLHAVPRGSSRLAPALLGLALTGATPAWACGGFFCSNQSPVDQSAERIVFAVDPEAGEVTTHVQITFAGTDPHDFAWVVPVPGIPELAVGTDTLFQELAWRTAPRFELSYGTIGECDESGGWGRDELAVPMADKGESTSGNATDDVRVVSEGQVGPYETAVLQARGSAELVEWLEANGYDLPPGLDPVLQPYVAAEATFVALRLQSDKEVGDLAPLAMRYAATKAMIPIQLTSIAATPDMRLETYVVGPHRAVPENYLHVRINPIAIDWESEGDNYDDVITLAADEAGGHAFATDYSGPSSVMADALHWEGRFDLDALRGIPTPEAYMAEIIDQGFPANDALIQVLADFIPVPDGVTAQDFYNCVECYPFDHSAFDAEALTAALDAVIVTPLVEAQALFDGLPVLSRLTSSLDAIEMTIDPIFVFNPDMGEEDGQWRARLVTDCGLGREYDESPMRLHLEDSFVIRLPSRAWLRSRGLTIREYLADLASINAQFIERTGASGAAEVLYDYTSALADAVDAHNEATAALFDEGRACGCTSSPSPVTGLLAGLGLAGLYARRVGGRRRRPGS